MSSVVKSSNVSSSKSSTAASLADAKPYRTADQLTEENRRLLAENEHYRKLTNDLLSSLSWRITSPLRSAAAFMRWVRRTFFPLWSTAEIELSPTPDKDVDLIGDVFKVSGLSPVIKLDSDALPAAHLEHGCFAKISIHCETKTSHQVFFVHPLLAPTVLEHLRITIPAESGRNTSMLTKIPPGTKRFALEPFGMKGEFVLKRISVQILSGPQAIYELIKQRCGGKISAALLVSKFFAILKVFRAGGLAAVRAKISPRNFSANYSDWVSRYDTFTPEMRTPCSRAVTQLRIQPLISIVMPVFNVEERWLRAAIDSVRSQVYENWQLCIADDKSTAPHVAKVLEEYKEKDSRIKVIFRSENGHIVQATNSALELATGAYTTFLDNDDELTPDALVCMVYAINRFPEGELFYSDEDKKTENGERFNPYFKSEWNPELILSQNYICHLSLYRTTTIKKLGGLRTGFEGAQDWDLALRVADDAGANRIHHIPHVLYHWRVIAGSTAQSTSAKPYVLAAQQKAVEEHMVRRGIVTAKVQIDNSISQLRVTLPIPVPHPLVSIVIPTKDRIDLLSQFLDSVLKNSSYLDFEFVLIDNGSKDSETFDYYQQLQKRWVRTTIINDDGPFNYARLNNRAIREAKGEYILLCNNDLEVISPDWIEQLLSFASLPGVGAVGARLLYPNGAIQHAGVVTGINGVAGHAFKGFPRHDVGYFNGAILPRTVSACTAACLMMRREHFDAVGGFDEQGLAIAFNDVDLCLKLGKTGLRNVYCPYAELYHYESASRGFETTPEKFLRFEGEIATMKQRWGDRLPNDPYYNPNLTILTEDYVFAFPPRRAKPWSPAGVTE